MDNYHLTGDEICIQFRVVVNDAVCRPWEPMPEVQPPTFSALVKYLREACGIDPRPLDVARTHGSGTMLSYGERKQFWLPTKLTDDDVRQMEEWHSVPPDVACPVCGEPMEFYEEYTMGFHPESYYAAFCRRCDLRMTKNSRMARLAIDLKEAIDKARDRRLAIGT